jgi:hypothetical protein
MREDLGVTQSVLASEINGSIFVKVISPKEGFDMLINNNSDHHNSRRPCKEAIPRASYGGAGYRLNTQPSGLYVTATYR